MTIISSSITFPGIGWWEQVVKADKLIIDNGEHFQKMSYRNRYRIAGANNSILLTVPLVKGRDQKSVMADILIHNAEKWQVQHWRTLVSAYRRSPFFDHYEPSLSRLFESPYTHLTHFNLESIKWVVKQLRLKLVIEETATYIVDYGPEIPDLRKTEPKANADKKYYQVFEDRLGFVSGLSILDLLFSEGPAVVEYLRK